MSGDPLSLSKQCKPQAALTETAFKGIIYLNIIDKYEIIDKPFGLSIISTQEAA
jgi:hypothetical protein